MRGWVLRVCLFLFNVLGIIIPIQERIIAALKWAVETEKALLAWLKQILQQLIAPPPTPPEG